MESSNVPAVRERAEVEGTRPARSAWVLDRRWLVVPAVLLVVLLVQGLVGVAGDTVRDAAMIELDTDSEGSLLRYSDAPGEAGAFYAARDTGWITVPWDMTVAELISLYHLENNPAVLDALRDRMGITEPEEILLTGTELSFPLTAAAR